MASPAEIGQGLPDTLPEDFSDWDGETSTTAVPTIDSDGLPSPGRYEEFPEPASPMPAPEISPAAVVEEWRGATYSTSGGNTDDQSFLYESQPDIEPSSHSMSYGLEAAHPADEDLFLAQPRSDSLSAGLSNGLRMPAPATPRVDELIESLRPKLAATRVEKRRGKKWVIVLAVSLCSILLLAAVGLWLFRPGMQSTAKQASEPAQTTDQPQLTSNTPKPSPATPMTQDAPPTATDTQPAQPSAASQPAEANAEDNPAPAVQSSMMSEQLAAPTRIARSIKDSQAENEPPPLTGLATGGGNDALGSGSGIASVFTSAGPVVRSAPAKPIHISAGVAVGLLIQKTPPVYPAIARASRISGTVEIQATISKMGTIKDVRALSGPIMLRQAAMDAVRNWRYKPYKLDNAPTEVQTTITVVFSLGG